MSLILGALDMNASETTLPALKLVASQRPLVIAHRGYCQFAPENTLPSFKLAMAAGADLVELDYYHSKDGKLVVIHDHDTGPHHGRHEPVGTEEDQGGDEDRGGDSEPRRRQLVRSEVCRDENPAAG